VRVIHAGECSRRGANERRGERQRRRGIDWGRGEDAGCGRRPECGAARAGRRGGGRLLDVGGGVRRWGLRRAAELRVERCGSDRLRVKPRELLHEPRSALRSVLSTYTNDGSGATGEAEPAVVSDFRLDKYLVTVGRFRNFVAAWNGGSGYAPPAGSGKHTHLNGGKGLVDSGNPPDAGSPANYETGWLTSDNSNIMPTNENLISCNPTYSTWTSTAGTQEGLPMNCVNWYEAYAFCIWDGGFLPSEAEFEYASAGGSQQREYPWGSTAPGTANQYAIYDCNYPTGPGSCAAATNIAPVGNATLGAGLWGQLDLVGELDEWMLDINAPYVDLCTDCAFLAGGSSITREIRGGFFEDSATLDLMSSYRNEGLYATDAEQSFGFRCARTP